jgi:uncharacterized protein YutE (UPF0331/DUF86 family)
MKRQELGDSPESITIGSAKLNSFMSSFSAATELKARADRLGCFVESVCLASSLIDGLLRMGLILKHQIETSSSALLIDLLEQTPEGSQLSEREVYRRARDAAVINQDTFAQLERLYGDRNKVVHRYVISRITTAEVLAIALAMDAATRQVSEQVAVLEQEQIRLGVGMTRAAAPGATEQRVLADLRSLATPKHGDEGLARALRQADLAGESPVQPNRRPKLSRRHR